MNRSLVNCELTAKVNDDLVKIEEFINNFTGFYPVAYLPSMIKYQSEYQKGNGLDVETVVLSIYSNGQIVGIWPIDVSRKSKENFFLGSRGGALLPPLLSNDLSYKQKVILFKKCYNFARFISTQLNIRHFYSEDVFVNNKSQSIWFKILLEDATEINFDFYLYTDLSKSIQEIKKQIRRSYNQLISRGETLWLSKIHNNVSEKLWNEFRDLHKRVSGRTTRSLLSWDIQRDTINAGHAFFVSLRDSKNNLIGGGLFTCTKDEVTYSVGVYNRDLFNEPISHLVLWLAIKEAQSSYWFNVAT